MRLTAAEQAAQRRNAAHEAERAERAAVRRVSHRPPSPGGTLGGARSVDELRAMCQELGIGTGGYRDALIARIRERQRELEAVAEAERQAALKEARARAENDVWRGQEAMNQEQWSQAAACFDGALRVLGDFPESVPYRTAARAQKMLGRRVRELEGELAYEQRQFVAGQRPATPSGGYSRVAPRRALLEALSPVQGQGQGQGEPAPELQPPPAAAGGCPATTEMVQGRGQEEQRRLGARCLVCTLANPCALHSALQQRAHRLMATQALLKEGIEEAAEAEEAGGAADPSSSRAGRQAANLALVTEEAQISSRLSSLAAAEAAERRAAEARGWFEAKERRHAAFVQRKAAAERAYQQEKQAEAAALKKQAWDAEWAIRETRRTQRCAVAGARLPTMRACTRLI
jgi:hypothetical protein